MDSKKIKTIISAVILLLIISGAVYYFLPAKEDSKNNVDDYFEFKIVRQDLEDWRKEDLTNRFNLTAEAAKNHPDDLSAWLELGQLKHSAGDYKGAEAVWIRIGEVRPLNSISFANLADLYANWLVDYDKAVSSYRTAIENSKGEVRNYLHYRNLFDFYINYLHDNKAGELTLLEGIENNPANSELLNLLASFYRDSGQTDKAIEYFEKSLLLDPSDNAIKKEVNRLKNL